SIGTPLRFRLLSHGHPAGRAAPVLGLMSGDIPIIPDHPWQQVSHHRSKWDTECDTIAAHDYSTRRCHVRSLPWARAAAFAHWLYRAGKRSTCVAQSSRNVSAMLWRALLAQLSGAEATRSAIGDNVVA